MTTVPLRPIGVPQEQVAGHYDAPYRAFLGGSLLSAVSGGFLLSVLLPLAVSLEWSWGADQRWPAMVQLHGQLQLMGFAGLFVMGMGLRIMPRVSGRHIAFPPLVPIALGLMVAYLIVRSTVHPLGDGVARDACLLGSAALLAGAAATFAAITWGTLLHRSSAAEAVGHFFALGALGLLASAALNAWQAWEMVRESLEVAPSGRQAALVFVQQFGFVMMFVGGVGSRAIPGLAGRPRRQIAPRATAVVFATAVAVFTGVEVLAAEGHVSETLSRAGDLALVAIGGSFGAMVWYSGALAPGSNVAAASRRQFWFVRCAFGWLAVAGALCAWYGAQSFADGRLPDQFKIDVIRHIVTVGVITTLIVGMGMLIVPEFAGRRLQHAREGMLHIGMILGLVVATGLRVWPSLEGAGWLETSRYWPMAVSGMLAATAMAVFAFMFGQSWWEQRAPGWAMPRGSGGGRRS